MSVDLSNATNVTLSYDVYVPSSSAFDNVTLPGVLLGGPYCATTYAAAPCAVVQPIVAANRLGFIDSSGALALSNSSLPNDVWTTLRIDVSSDNGVNLWCVWRILASDARRLNGTLIASQSGDSTGDAVPAPVVSARFGAPAARQAAIRRSRPAAAPSASTFGKALRSSPSPVSLVGMAFDIAAGNATAGSTIMLADFSMQSVQ